MNSPIVIENLTKRFGNQPALQSINLRVPAGRVIGLLGRNGAGKTTLLNIACGLVLPTEGSCETLGRQSRLLESSHLIRLGLVPQESRLLEWMKVQQHLAFTASFYRNWDSAREKRLLAELELDEARKIGQLSSGDQQKLSIILAVCHHPSLILLDEPISALDPIVRIRLLNQLLAIVREDECTVVISSHILADLEKIIDWVVCLDHGEVAVHAALDEIQESYAEWTVTAPDGGLPDKFPEPFVLSQEGNSRQVRLCVRCGSEGKTALAAKYRAEIASRPLTLEQLFPLLLRERILRS
ncbi:MAG TPA: ABC transporter ATP-binding protein [Opitutaceae bacterium]|jgi:ABC-2 type transport system ATP-binding protein